MKKTKPSKKGLYTAATGTVIVALCCFTPILVVTVGIVGLSALTPYLDYVLYPALAVMLVVTYLAYKKWKQGCNNNEIEEKDNI
ncbi:MAG: mercury resistance system transport protein MerF [Candidatus Pacebacteria bacterium]|nr:mercury resistance system transport protein MerF [Candidatus Paceibacterota bacterium]